MIHPFIRLLVSRPQLVLEHLGGYADMAAAQMQMTLGTIKTRAVLMGACVGLMLLTVFLAGVALLLWGAIPEANMPRPWLLWVAPLVPLLGAIVCLVLVKQRPLALSLDAFREQAALDAALFREVSVKP